MSVVNEVEKVVLAPSNYTSLAGAHGCARTLGIELDTTVVCDVVAIVTDVALG